MSTIIRCDRCGRTVPPAASFRLRVELSPAASLSTPPAFPPKDLCRPCFDELRDWLKREEESDGENRV